MKIGKSIADTIRTANESVRQFFKRISKAFDSKLFGTFKCIDTKYELLNQKRLQLELQQIQFKLQQSCGIKPGILIKNISKVAARSNILQQSHKTNWVTIPEGSTLLFLGADLDEVINAVTLKVLWKQQVYYIHKNSGFKNFEINFFEKFIILL